MTCRLVTRKHYCNVLQQALLIEIMAPYSNQLESIKKCREQVALHDRHVDCASPSPNCDLQEALEISVSLNSTPCALPVESQNRRTESCLPIWESIPLQTLKRANRCLLYSMPNLDRVRFFPLGPDRSALMSTRQAHGASLRSPRQQPRPETAGHTLSTSCSLSSQQLDSPASLSPARSPAPWWTLARPPRRPAVDRDRLCSPRIRRARQLTPWDDTMAATAAAAAAAAAAIGSGTPAGWREWPESVAARGYLRGPVTIGSPAPPPDSLRTPPSTRAPAL